MWIRRRMAPGGRECQRGRRDVGPPSFFVLMFSRITQRPFFAFGDYKVVFKFVSVGFGDYFFSLAGLGLGVLWRFCECLLEMS